MSCLASRVLQSIITSPSGGGSFIAMQNSIARGMQAEAALNARCTQSGPTGLQSEPMGRQFSSRLFSLHSRTSRSRALNAKRTILLPFTKQYRAWVQVPAYPTDFTPGTADSTLEYAAGPGSVSCRSLPFERVRSKM